MEFVNDNDRAKALVWWRGMTEEQQKAMVAKYFNISAFFAISKSSNMIQRIWTKEVGV
jgi:hypothetical protein